MKILPLDMYRADRDHDYAKVQELIEKSEPHVTWFGLYVLYVPGYWLPVIYSGVFGGYVDGRPRSEKTWLTDPDHRLPEIREKVLDLGQRLIEIKYQKCKITQFFSDIIDPLTYWGCGTDAMINNELVRRNELIRINELARRAENQ